MRITLANLCTQDVTSNEEGDYNGNRVADIPYKNFPFTLETKNVIT